MEVTVASGKKADKAGVHVPETVDVAAIRKRQNLSQEKFARKYGIAPGTWRDWEQGVRDVPAIARAFLTVIDKEPDAVLRALRGSAR
jgi:putative transcriptional regulator